MLAEGRRIASGKIEPCRGRNRQARDPRFLPLRATYGLQEVQRREMSVIEQIERCIDRRAGQPCLVQALDRGFKVELSHERRGDVGKARMLSGASHIRAQALVSPQFVQAELGTEALPVIVAQNGNENVLVVARTKRPVDAPAQVASHASFGERLRHLARHTGPGDVLTDEEYDALEQTDIDLAADAGASAVFERYEYTNRREHRPRDIDNRRAAEARTAGRAGHISETSSHLRGLVGERQVAVQSGQESLDGRVDQARISGRERFIIEPRAIQGTRREVIDQHIAFIEQAQQQRLVGWNAQFEANAPLVRVVADEMALVVRIRARLIAAARTFDLGDLGAELGKNQRRGWPRHDVTKLNHFQRRKRLIRTRPGHFQADHDAATPITKAGLPSYRTLRREARIRHRDKESDEATKLASTIILSDNIFVLIVCQSALSAARSAGMYWP